MRSTRYFKVVLFLSCAILAGSFGLVSAQCETFGLFDIGEDVEINCVDSCIQLVSPNIASVAIGGSDYEVEEIDYDLPYALSLIHI